MTDALESVLTAQELEILADELPVHLLRYDVEEQPECDHCSRSARYSVILGHEPDERGYRKKVVCDVCLERFYSDLDTPLPARMTD